MRHLVIATALLFASGARAHAQSAPVLRPAAAAQSASAPAATDATAPAAPAPQITAAAAAKPGMDNAISAFGVFGYLYASTGVGVAGRYQKTVVPQGFLHLPNVHDDFGIEGGVDYYHYGFDGYSLNEFVALVGVVWNFWFDDGKLALYPKVESGFGFGSFSGFNGDAIGYGGFTTLASAGIVYKLSALTLRGEVGSGSLRLGAGLVF